MIGRSFNDLFRQDTNYNIWGNTLPFLQSRDIVGINLETTLTDSNNAIPKEFNFKLSPKYASVLTEANISYCSLANNHILDYSIEGLVDTTDTLDQMGIRHNGAGLSLSKAMEPTIINGVAFFSAADHPSEWAATSKNPGIWYLSDTNKAIRGVRKIRPYVDTIVFSLHWGPNYSHDISPDRRRLAYDLTNAGVDIIHGHSSHHIQEIEEINSGIVFYGMGDFIDDYYSPMEGRMKKYESNKSLLVDITLVKGRIIDVELYSTKISNMQVNFDSNQI